jgi:hypothetical protein
MSGNTEPDGAHSVHPVAMISYTHGPEAKGFAALRWPEAMSQQLLGSAAARERILCRRMPESRISGNKGGSVRRAG